MDQEKSAHLNYRHVLDHRAERGGATRRNVHKRERDRSSLSGQRPSDPQPARHASVRPRPLHSLLYSASRDTDLRHACRTVWSACIYTMERGRC